MSLLDVFRELSGADCEYTWIFNRHPILQTTWLGTKCYKTCGIREQLVEPLFLFSKQCYIGHVIAMGSVNVIVDAR